MEAAGLEGVMECGCNCEMVLSGAGFMTAKDLARCGLVFARLGADVHGEAVGDREFIEVSLSGRRTTREYGIDWQDDSLTSLYSNQTMVPSGFPGGPMLGHGGFGGQYLMADPVSGATVSFFSVLETTDASNIDIISGGGTYNGEVVGMLVEIMLMLREGHAEYAMGVNLTCPRV